MTVREAQRAQVRPAGSLLEAAPGLFGRVMRAPTGCCTGTKGILLRIRSSEIACLSATAAKWLSQLSQQ